MSKKATESKKQNIIKCTDFDVDNFSAEPFDLDNERSKTQAISYPRYSGENCLFTTESIHFTQYGVSDLYQPKDGETAPEWAITDDKKRGFIRIPNDPNQKACQNLFNMLRSIDERMEKLAEGNPDNEVFALPDLTPGELKKKPPVRYQYSPLVHEPSDPAPPKPGKKPSAPKMQFAKVKFDTSYPDGNLVTPVFVMENGKPQLRSNVKTITDLTETFAWNDSARFVIMISKIWAAKTAMNGVKNYGVSLKCMQMVVTNKNSTGSQSVRNQLKTCVFEDEDNVEQNVEDDNQDVNNAEQVDEVAEEEAAEDEEEVAEEEEEVAEDEEEAAEEEEVAEEEEEEEAIPSPPAKKTSAKSNTTSKQRTK